MTILLILFSISLIGILVMIGRKVSLLRTGALEIKNDTGFNPLFPDLEKIKELAKGNAKRYGYRATVAGVRLYVRSANLLKTKSAELKSKISKLVNKNGANVETAPKEANKFLQMISDYKNKVRAIKHKIHEEEKKS